MKNLMTRDLLVHSVFPEYFVEDDDDDILEHHGVEGMSWGDRNGPPYPLGGVDKKIARAEYKRKKEKERRLKKLQRAAKKARKAKKKEEERQADILKKKQKLMKKGDLDAIRKNAKLFTNEELQYAIERDEQKRALKGDKERSKDEAMDLAIRRMAQIGDIAASAQKVLAAAKVGAEVVGQFKSNRVKDMEADEKRWNAIAKEFESLNKVDPDAAANFLRGQRALLGRDQDDARAQRAIDRQNRQNGNAGGAATGGNTEPRRQTLRDAFARGRRNGGRSLRSRPAVPSTPQTNTTQQTAPTPQLSGQTAQNQITRLTESGLTRNVNTAARDRGLSEMRNRGRNAFASRNAYRPQMSSLPVQQLTSPQSNRHNINPQTRELLQQRLNNGRGFITGARNRTRWTARSASSVPSTPMPDTRDLLRSMGAI